MGRSDKYERRTADERAGVKKAAAGLHAGAATVTILVGLFGTISGRAHFLGVVEAALRRGSLALPAACTVWFFLAPDDPAPYLATIDALPVPSAWEVVHTQAIRSFLGSRADRYYLVDAEPEDIAPVVEGVLRSAGLEIYDRVASSDWCDQRPIGATPAIACPRKAIPTCRENGPGGSVSCTVQAFRWLSMEPSLEASMLERLYVSVSPRGDVFDVGVNDQRHRIDASNRALVVISADRATARYFWSSPTPRPSETPK